MASKSLIDKLIALGGTVPANAEAVPDAVLEGMIAALSGGAPVEVPPSLDPLPAVTAPVTEPVPKPELDPEAVQKAAMDALDYVTQSGYLSKEPTTPEPTGPIRVPAEMEDDELAAYVNANPGNALAQREFTFRENEKSRSWLTNLLDQEQRGWAQGRVARLAQHGLTNALNIPAQGAGLYGVIANPVQGALGIDIGAEAALEYAAEQDRKAYDFWNVTPPRNTGESLAQLSGYLVPIPGAGPTSALGNILEVTTPFVFGATAPRIATNLAISFAAEQGIREAVDGGEDPYTTVFDAIGVADASDSSELPITAGIALAGMATLSLVAPLGMHILRTQKSKPTQMRLVTDINPHGPVGLWSQETAGDLYKAQAVDQTQVLLDQAERAGVPNTADLSRMIDLDTGMAAATRVTNGLETGILRGQHGDFVSPIAPSLLFGVYKKMPKPLQDNVSLYLKLGDYADDLRLQMSSPNPTPGWNPAAELAKVKAQRAQLRALDPQIGAFSNNYQRVTAAVRDFLSTGPYAMLDKKAVAGLGQQRQHYVHHVEQTVNPNDSLLARIVDATESKRDASDTINFLEKRDWLHRRGIGATVDPVDALMDYTRYALQSKLHNDVRMAVIDGFAKSKLGAKTVKKLKGGTPAKIQPPTSPGGKAKVLKAAVPAEEAKAPWLVEGWRNGKKERWHTTRLRANILRMDPYAVTGPVDTVLFGMKRLAEMGMTGPLSVTFAGKTFMRDTVTGWAQAVGRDVGPTPVGAAMAIPKQLFAKMQHGLAKNIEERLATGNPLPFVNPQAQAQLAQRLSLAHMNSLYYRFQSAGGYHGNLNVSPIEAGNNVIRQIEASLPPWVGKVYGRSAKPLIQGLGAIVAAHRELFTAVSEAPRFNAAERMIKAGVPADDAVRRARKITGDNTKSGRSYTVDGKQIRADAVNKEAMVAAPITGAVTEALRKYFPYSNPTIQGMRRMINSAAADPIGFNLKSWASIGIPGLAAVAWNEMLSQNNPDGYNYSEFNFNERSAQDQTMRIYFGIPGQPPEKGIFIDISHEQAMFLSPFQAALYHASGSNEEIKQAVIMAGMNVLENAGNFGLPTFATTGFALGGVDAPDSIWELLSGNAYIAKEDRVGLLPQNIEMWIREQFGQTAIDALEVALAFTDSDFDLKAAMDEGAYQLLERTPVAGPLAGTKTPVTYFTNLNTQDRAKMDAAWTFREYYEEHFLKEDLFRKTPLEDREGGISVPITPIVPRSTAKPVNPIYEMFGEQIYNAVFDDAVGMDVVAARAKYLTQQINYLKAFNAGRKKEFEAFQRELEDTPNAVTEAVTFKQMAEALVASHPARTKAGSPEQAAKQQAQANLKKAKELDVYAQERMKVYTLVKENNLDLGSNFDITRLHAILERERNATMQEHLALLRKVEDDITNQMIAEGLIPPGQRFSFERDLAPMGGPKSPVPQTQQELAPTGP